MANDLLELLRQRQSQGRAQQLQVPRYYDAMVISKGTVDDLTAMPFLNPASQQPSGTTLKFREFNREEGVRYTFLYYVDEEYVDPKTPE